MTPTEMSTPEFPLWWLDESKRNMEGLQEIAFHLHTKAAEGRRVSAGFRGTPNEMETQIIETLTSVQQQVSVLSDVIESVLQIIAADHERRKHRGKRALAWIRGTAQNIERTLVAHVVYRILAIIGTLATLWLLVRWFLIHLHGR